MSDFTKRFIPVSGKSRRNTSTIFVGPCVTDPYARHPARAVMAIATLDEISEGRAILAIGAGNSGFAVLQIDRRKPERAMREAIGMIRALLRGETFDFQGDVIAFNHGRLNFSAPRAQIPIHVASNGLVGQRMAAETADGIIMHACASVTEVRALRAALNAAANQAGRDPRAIKIIARLNTCIATDGRAARDAVRLSVARYLSSGILSLRTTLSQRLRFLKKRCRG
jgi:5,10-methylenetetrahydromethanopterin reductase